MTRPRPRTLQSSPAPARPAEGLRSRKKAQQRAQILDAAMLLLRDRGYDPTRIEDVARVADVSLKTVYNYFPSKQALLIELLREDRSRLLEAYEAVAKNPPDDLAEALALILHADIGDAVTPENKLLWREMLAAETRSYSDPNDGFSQNRAVFKGFVRRILEHFVKDGKLSSEVDLTIAVGMVYSLLMYDFREYCADRDMTPDDFLELTRRQTRLLVSGWLRTDDPLPRQRSSAPARSR
jgi:AcrR family transcriptional regulator